MLSELTWHSLLTTFWKAAEPAHVAMRLLPSTSQRSSRRWGYRPLGENGTFFQRVPLREIAVDSSNCSATLLGQGIAQNLKWGEDFIMSGSPWNENASVEAPVVFVGYGVISPDGQYDDYSGV